MRTVLSMLSANACYTICQALCLERVRLSSVHRSMCAKGETLCGWEERTGEAFCSQSPSFPKVYCKIWPSCPQSAMADDDNEERQLELESIEHTYHDGSVQSLAQPDHSWVVQARVLSSDASTCLHFLEASLRISLPQGLLHVCMAARQPLRCSLSCLLL